MYVRGTAVVLCVRYHTSCYIHVPLLYVENKVPLSFCGVFKICIVWIGLKTFCSKVLVTFVDHFLPFQAP